MLGKNKQMNKLQITHSFLPKNVNQPMHLYRKALNSKHCDPHKGNSVPKLIPDFLSTDLSTKQDGTDICRRKGGSELVICKYK